MTRVRLTERRAVVWDNCPCTRASEVLRDDGQASQSLCGRDRRWFIFSLMEFERICGTQAFKGCKDLSKNKRIGFFLKSTELKVWMFFESN